MAPYTKINNINSPHFEAIFYYATMGIVITDEKGNIAAVNPFALKEFGYKEEELIGEKVEKLVPVRFRQKHSQHHKKYVESKQTRMMSTGLELFALGKNGKEFPVEISLSNYRKNGNRYSIAFINNITVRRKAEAEIALLHTELEAKINQRTSDLNVTLQQLEESQALQQALFENAGAIIIATDEKGIIRFFNPEAVRSTGYTEKEVINKRTPILFHDMEELSRKRKKLIKDFGLDNIDDFSVLVERSNRNVHTEEQYTFIRKDKSRFPVVLTISTIRNAAGIITGYIGIAIDISDRKKAEENLIESLKKEKELSELKSRFISMASHEFRTPLSTVLSSAYLIEKYNTAEDQPKRVRHLERIIESVNMLTDILNDFLSVGKIEEGKIQVRPSVFPVKEFMLKIAEDLRGTLKKDQTISYRHSGLPAINMDASLLKHIVMNLVSNASKFSGEGHAIDMRTKLTADQFIFSVKDTGIGISKQDQGHLMERFFRGANANNIQGTGLGLHIVSKYAELMKGVVHCSSELEKGTTFTITFNIKTDTYEKDTADRRQ